MHFPEFQLTQYVKARQTVMSTLYAYWGNPCRYIKYSRLPTRNWRWYVLWSIDASCHKWIAWRKEGLSPITCGLLDLWEKRSVQRMAYCSRVTDSCVPEKLRQLEPLKPFIKVTMVLTKCNWEPENPFSGQQFQLTYFRQPKVTMCAKPFPRANSGKHWCRMKFPKDPGRSWPLISISSNSSLAAIFWSQITTADSRSSGECAAL